MASVYAMLSEFPGAKQVADAHLTRLTNLLSESSKGRYGKETAIAFRNAARTSIGSNMPAKSLELKHTIKLIRELTSDIDEIEHEIKLIMDEINSPILSIPGINYRMGAMIIAESAISTVLILLIKSWLMPDYLLLHTSQDNLMAHTPTWKSVVPVTSAMRCFNATKFVCIWDNQFSAYLAKKRSEGKHYNVAISHAAKKLVRVIYQLEKSGQLYHRAA